MNFVHLAVSRPFALLPLAALCLAGCATVAPPAVPAAAAPSPSPAASAVAARFATPAPAAAAPSASSPTARPDPAAPRPFDDVIKGATRQAGFLSLWRKDEKLWLEVPVDQLDKPFLFSANISHSVGERGLYAAQMGSYWLASFRRIGATQLQLVALNTDFVATTPQMKLVVEQGFSNSLLASATIASAPHPERKSVLV
ncbi:MAG: DUF5118 domain-containing protein, partial [Rhizobacter sp.]